MPTVHEDLAYDTSTSGIERRVDLRSALRDILAEFRIISRRFNRAEVLMLVVLVSLLWTIFEIRTNTDALLSVVQACS
jgi:hypothetical protein